MFANIEECEYPISEMKIELEMNVWSFQEESLYNDIIGVGSDFQIVQELPEEADNAISDTLRSYMEIFY